MDTYKKVGNVLGIIAAWILSIVLVLTLIVTPIALSALSLLNTNTILDVVTDSLTQDMTPDTGDTAANYGVSQLSDVVNPNEDDVSDAAGEIGGAMLEGILGDQADQELVNEILSSDVAKDFIKVYTDGIANAFTDGAAGKAFDETMVKEFVNENIDQIVALAKQALPELSDADEQELKDAILSKVNENAEEFFNFLPKPEQLKDAIMEENPELAVLFQIFARRKMIKAVYIGFIVLLSGLIFLCRLPGLRGFRWLSTDLFVASGFCLLQSIGLLVGGSVIKGMLASEPALAGLVGRLVSKFTTGVTVRSVIMLVCAVGLLLAYIFIKKARAKKLAAPAAEAVAEEAVPAEPAEAEALVTNSENDKYDIIILAGQSNAQGEGRGPVTREFAPDERIHFMTDDANPEYVKENDTLRLVMKWPAVNSISVADERMLEDQKVGCFALQFAECYVNSFLQPGRKALIVNANFGGTGFSRPEWGVGNCMHERLIAMTQEALSYNPENRVVAVLWSQGEHDASENADWDAERRYRTHKANLTATFADFYERIGCKDVPVLACGFTDGCYESNPTAHEAVLTAIREVIADIGGGFVDSSGLPANSDKDYYHFNRESLHILGERFFQKYIQLRP